MIGGWFASFFLGGGGGMRRFELAMGFASGEVFIAVARASMCGTAVASDIGQQCNAISDRSDLDEEIVFN